jgi:hypothetical protein
MMGMNMDEVSSAFSSPAAAAPFANCAQSNGVVGRAKADESRQQGDGPDGSKPGVIDHAIDNEAEADNNANYAICGSDVLFHVSLGGLILWPGAHSEVLYNYMRI